jgi:hypothetical protein
VFCKVRTELINSNYANVNFRRLKKLEQEESSLVHIGHNLESLTRETSKLVQYGRDVGRNLSDTFQTCAVC